MIVISGKNEYDHLTEVENLLFELNCWIDGSYLDGKFSKKLKKQCKKAEKEIYSSRYYYDLKKLRELKNQKS